MAVLFFIRKVMTLKSILKKPFYKFNMNKFLPVLRGRVLPSTSNQPRFLLTEFYLSKYSVDTTSSSNGYFNDAYRKLIFMFALLLYSVNLQAQSWEPVPNVTGVFESVHFVNESRSYVLGLFRVKGMFNGEVTCNQFNLHY